MDSQNPAKLMDLAKQSLLQDEACAVAAVGSLPSDLFPSLFMSAIAGRHSKIMEAIVKAWPFSCLSLGALMPAQQSSWHDMVKAALNGIGCLLAQEFRPRTWRLQVLDLRTASQIKLEQVWAGSGMQPPVRSSGKKEAVQPGTERLQVEGSRPRKNRCLVSVQVIVSSLCFMEPSPNELLSFLVERVRQEKPLPMLHCNKLEFLSEPPQNQIVQKILEKIDPGCVYEMEVKCIWDVLDLARFAPYLGQMVNLKRLYLSRLCLSSGIPLEATDLERICTTLSTQLARLHKLQSLDIAMVRNLAGKFFLIFRYLQNPLKSLSITDSLLIESDLASLSLSPSTSCLSRLHITDVKLTGVNVECLQFVLERSATTLEQLDFSRCGITDSQLTALLPALGRCFQLHGFGFGGNSISRALLETLLWHVLPRRRMLFLQVPFPLEFYTDEQGPVDLATVEAFQAQLDSMLLDLTQWPDWLQWSSDLEEGCYSLYMRIPM